MVYIATKTMFNPKRTAEIVKTVLSSNPHADKWMIQIEENDVKFNVRSA